jgi:hypothetical protein
MSLAILHLFETAHCLQQKRRVWNIPSFFNKTSFVFVLWLAILLNIREVPGSSRIGVWLKLLRAFVFFFLNYCKKMLGQYLKINHDRNVLNNFQFFVHNHIIRCYECRLKTSWTGGSAPLLCCYAFLYITAALCRQSANFLNGPRI